MNQPIDNFELLRPLMQTESDYDFFHIQLLRRGKDFPEILWDPNHPCMSIYVRNDNPLDLWKDFIIKTCEENRWRAYFNPNKMYMPEVRAHLWDCEKWAFYDKERDDMFKKNKKVDFYRMGYPAVWILDVDLHEPGDEYDQEISAYLQKNNVTEILRVPTLHGFHILVPPHVNVEEFNTLFPDTVIHQGHPTILYVPLSISSQFEDKTYIIDQYKYMF